MRRVSLFLVWVTGLVFMASGVAGAATCEITGGDNSRTTTPC